MSPPSEPPGEIISFGVSPVNYSDSERLLRTRFILEMFLRAIVHAVKRLLRIIFIPEKVARDPIHNGKVCLGPYSCWKGSSASYSCQVLKILFMLENIVF